MHSNNCLKLLFLTVVLSISQFVNAQTAEQNKHEAQYIEYRNKGIKAWYSSNSDSALYYFKKAIEELSKTEPVPYNKYYRNSLLNNNLAGVYRLQGNTTASIEAMENSIKNIRLFLADKEPHPEKKQALVFLFEATDNLGGIYKELGDYTKTHDLLWYSYQQKKTQLPAGNDAVYKSEILLGQLYFSTRHYSKANEYLLKGFNALKSLSDDQYLFWLGDACYTMALMNDQLKQKTTAAEWYEKADSLYDKGSDGMYDMIYLEFLRNAGLFYAENNMLAKGIQKAQKAYNYVLSTENEGSLLPFYHLLNFSEINNEAKNYEQALHYSTQALKNVNLKISKSETLLDSLLMEAKKPKGILLRAKAQYGLLKNKTVEALETINNDLKEALILLERRKTVLQNEEDINLMLADHTDLLDFIKKITYDLYKTSGNSKYIVDLLSLHESGIYNRLRSRLDKRDVALYRNVPKHIIEKEKQLKLAIPASLQQSKLSEGTTSDYIEAINNWNEYLATIQQQYPHYYQMRFGSIFKPLAEIHKTIPEETTIIRYFFASDKLLAFIADEKHIAIKEINSSGLNELIQTLSEKWMDPNITAATLSRLHHQLWTPIEKEIEHNNVIIIPDGILYHISFEALIPGEAKNFQDIAHTSLINKYNFSYAYSLFLIEASKNRFSSKENFIGFAPGFHDKEKDIYKQHVKDSIYLDQMYLSLLPLPFTHQLAEKMYEIFGGKLFINSSSTSTSFKNNAGHHTIVHIGTHAESNNTYPELSRLIFSKEPSDIRNDNSVFLFDIYNCDISSQLTVLTACESGKPGLKDGEGMISLAHAFNYAGSESILTGLWKIDEQTSTVITELFYRNLLKGLKKDNALRLAKLEYLQSAQSRTLAPQYWAGLIIMGDTSPIVLQKKSYWAIYMSVGLIACVLIGITLRPSRQARPSSASH